MSQLKRKSGVADGSTAIAHELDTVNSLVTGGAKLWSIKNAGVEKFSLNKDGSDFNISSFKTWTVRPDEGRAGIMTALNAAKTAGGGIVQLLAGTYVIDNPGISIYDLNYVTLQGVGDDTILQHNNDISGFTTLLFQATTVSYAGNATTNGQTSVYTTAPADAGNFLTGDRIVIRGDVRSDDGSGFLDLETNIVAANGNVGTGEIQLLNPLQYTMTSITFKRSRTAQYSWVKNLKFTFTGSNGLAAASINGYYKSGFENITVEGGKQTGGYGVFGLGASIGAGYPGFYCEINNCRIRGAESSGIALFHQKFSSVKNCILDNIGNPGGSFYTAAIVIERECGDCLIKNNTITNVIHGWGIGVGGTVRRRISAIGNRIMYADNAGLGLDNFEEISGNYIEDVGLGGVTSSFTGAIMAGYGALPCKGIIKNNIIKKCRYGIDVYPGSHISIFNNIVREFTEYGILMGAHSTCVGNIIIGSGIGIGITHYATGANLDGHQSSGNIVKNCTTGFYLSFSTYGDLGSNLGSTLTYGINFFNCNNNIIVGNHLQGSAYNYGGTNTDNDLIGNKL